MFSYLKSKSIFVLVVFLIASVVIGALQSESMDTDTPFIIHDVARIVLYPVQYFSSTAYAKTEELAEAARPRSAILAENDELRKQVKSLSLENMRLRELARQNSELREALGLAKVSKLKMQPAQVIAREASNWFDTAIINRGSSHHVKIASAVIDHNGLIGQVVEVDRYTSQFVALTEERSSVSGMVRRSGTVGIVRGEGTDYVVLSYMDKDADVKVGDVIVSSGMGQVIPAGIHIGRVNKVVRDSVAGQTSALVRPSVEFDKIRYVFVVDPVKNTHKITDNQ